MPRAFLAFLALAILAIVAINGYQAALENAGQDITVTNESFTPDPGNVTILDDSERSYAYYLENVSVYDNGGALMERGTDYIWFQGNGTVKTIAGGGLDGEPNAEITYGYQQTTEEQREFAHILDELPRMMGLALPLGTLLLLLWLLGGG